MTNLIEIRVPDIGASGGVNVAEVYVKPGDKIKLDDNLLMLETDKATMEVPSTGEGTVRDVKIKPNDKVSEGDVILTLEIAASSSAGASKVEVGAAKAPSKSVDNKVEAKNDELPADMVEDRKPAAENAPAKSPSIDQDSFDKAFASPGIRKLARELGADLGRINGSGDKGRITEEDLKSFVKDVMQGNVAGSTLGGGLDLLPWPKVDFAKFGEVEVQSLSRIKKLSGANLVRNWVMIPHVTQFDEANITELEVFRKDLSEEYKAANIKITPLAFLIKAVIFALREFPEFNSSLDGDNLVYKKYYNIGFAADTPQGLVVPVLKNADRLGVVEIARETASLAKLAREGKLKPTDMQGGTFTISSLGGIGGTAFTPIINAPEVAILGVSKASIKPIWNGSEFKPGLMLPLALSYDHRVIDGALAAKFTSYLAKLLADIRRLSL